MIKNTCHVCSRPYNIANKYSSIGDCPKHIYLDSPSNICPPCLIKKLKDKKAPIRQNLIPIKREFDELKKLYDKKYQELKTLTKAYNDIDYYENLIQHNFNNINAIKPTKKLSINKKHKSTKSSKALAKKLLDELSNEQRATVLAQLK